MHSRVVVQPLSAMAWTNSPKPFSFASVHSVFVMRQGEYPAVSATAAFAGRANIRESAANRAIERRITSPAPRAAVNLQLPGTQKFPAVGLEETNSIGCASA